MSCFGVWRINDKDDMQYVTNLRQGSPRPPKEKGDSLGIRLTRHCIAVIANTVQETANMKARASSQTYAVSPQNYCRIMATIWNT